MFNNISYVSKGYTFMDMDAAPLVVEVWKLASEFLVVVASLY
jgi:hypothetical protein